MSRIANTFKALKEKNKKEWQRINNLWLEVKNNHKSQNPNLYDTESDNSDDNDKPKKKIMKEDAKKELTKYHLFINYKNTIDRILRSADKPPPIIAPCNTFSSSKLSPIPPSIINPYIILTNNTTLHTRNKRYR